MLLALVISLPALLPLLTHAGLPNTADGPVHLMRQVELNRAWQEGVFYPRWGADLALGHGMPIFSYAPPLLYHLTQLFHLTGLPLDEAMKAVLVVDFLLYSLGMFLFTRRVFGPGPALVAAAVYVYAPYRLREAYIQGNYGQFTGLAFYPLIFWAFHRLITGKRLHYLPPAALALAGLLLSHNISSMLFMPVFAAYLLFLLLHNGVPWPKKAPHLPIPIVAGLNTAAAGLLGLGVSAIFWLPAFGEREAIKLEGITRGFFDFRANFISLPEFLSPPLPLDLAAINPEFPLSLGLAQIIGAGLSLVGLAVLGIAATSKKNAFSQTAAPVRSLTRPQIYHALFFALFLLLYAFLALPASQPVWEAVPLLELAEFPWRMLGPAIFCAAALSAAGIKMAADKFASGPKSYPVLMMAALVGVIGVNAWYLYPSQFIPWGTPTPADAFAYEAASGAIGTTSTGEFLPRAAQQHPRPHTLWPDYKAGRPPHKLDPATLPPGATVTITGHYVEADILQIHTPAPFTATLRTLYWPGWQVYLDGKPAAFSITPNTGLIQTTIPAGQHTLTLRLESTPLRTAGQWLTLVSLVILVGVGVVGLATGQNRPAPQAGAFSLRFFAVAAILLAALYPLSRPLAPFFVLHSNPNRPQPADRILQVDFGNRIRLVGVDALPQTVAVQPPQTAELAVTVYWRALQPLDANYSVFLHLDAPNGQTFATVDEVNPENIPTRNWPPGLYLRNPLRLQIPGDIPPIRYNLTVGVYNRETGRRLPILPGETTAYTLGPVWVSGPQPRLSGPAAARFGPAIHLLQANYRPNHLTLYWQVNQPDNRNASIFVHLLDEAGNLLGQADGVPYNGLYPPANWLPGQIITDDRPLPQTGPPAAIAVGVYNPDTGQRLPAVDSRGNALPNNSYLLRVSP